MARNETGMAHVSMIHHCLAVKQTHHPYLNFNYDDINDESILLCNLMTELQFSFVAEEIITNVPGWKWQTASASQIPQLLTKLIIYYNMMVPSTTAIIIVIKTAARHMIYK